MKKSYKILSIINKMNGKVRPYNGKLNIDYDIYSIERLEDNMIFTLGDSVKDKYSSMIYGNITKIWISFEQLRIDIGRMGLVLCHDEDHRTDIVLNKLKT